MLRLVLLVLIVSGAWASWQSLAEWRSGLFHAAGPDTARRSQPLTFSVPAELLPPQQWASVDPVTATDAALPDRANDGTVAQTDEPPAGARPESEANAAPQSAAAAQAADSSPEEHSAAQPELPPADQLPAAIQTELKRLGFYRGRIDNMWGPRSRAALEQFAEVHKVQAGDEPTAEVYRAVRAAAPVTPPVVTAEKPKPGARQRQPSMHAARAVPEEKSYLPPWLSGSEAEPAPQRAQVATRRAAPAAPRPAAATRAERQQQAERRQARQRTAIEEHFRRNGFMWPGL